MTRRAIYAALMQTLLASELDGTLDANSRTRAMLLASELIKKHGALVDALEVLRDAVTDLESRRIAREAIEQDEKGDTP